MNKDQLHITYVPVSDLIASDYNPRSWSEDAIKQLTQSIKQFGFVDPLLVNSAPKRKGVVIGGHFRLSIAKDLGLTEVPVVYINIPNLDREKELNIRLNKNVGDWDWDLLGEFDEAFLGAVGFSSEELDEIFPEEEAGEEFNLKKELEKLDITKVSIKPGDIYELNGSRLMCGDSTISVDMRALMNGEQADMCFTDPPYILEYLNEKTASKGFGSKLNRRYIGTDSLPENFTELWMGNIAEAARPDFSIIVYENWRNIRTIWDEMEKHWKVKNMIVWHTTNRSQGYPSKYRFLSKHDIAMVGSSKNKKLSTAPEGELLDNEYETALYAIAGKPQWEGYEAGKRIQPTDFIEYRVANAKSSEQSVVFGTKPIEILIPYIKVLTKRGDLIVEPFGGSGSTLIASLKMERRCYIMEKNPAYAEVIKKRWEKLAGRKAVKVHG